MSPSRLRASLALAAAVACGAAPPRAPLFNFDTVPVYQHLAAVNTSLFPTARAAWLARHYPLIIIEHVQDQGYLYKPPSGAKAWGPEPFTPPTAFFEDAAARVATQLKDLNTSTIVLYYQNANSGLPWYRLSAPLASNAHPEFRLKNGSCHSLGDSGDAMVPYESFDFDHRVDGVQPWFVASFLDTTARFPVFDGVYIDQDGASVCSPAQFAAVVATVAAIQAASPDLIVGFDETNGVPSGAAGFRAAMDYSLCAPTVPGRAPPRLNSGLDAVRWLRANGDAGVISLAHDGADAPNDGLYNYSLSVFLAGMHETTPSYFAYCSMRKNAPLWEDCWDGGSDEAPVFPTWCAGMGGSSDFLRPLGPPLGAAVPTGRPGDEVTRSFASGTRVTVELSGEACLIAWSDGHRTACAG
jgi:hypothetical protein